MPSWKKVILSGSDATLNSLYVTTNVTASSFTGSFTGSFLGTSSFASQALSSSFASTSSYVNTLNQNAQMLNEQRLQAQAGINTAQDQAYQDFLAQSAQRGQVASAMAASDAGDVYQQTIRQMSTLYGNDPSKWTSSQWQQVTQQVTGANNK